MMGGVEKGLRKGIHSSKSVGWKAGGNWKKHEARERKAEGRRGRVYA